MGFRSGAGRGSRTPKTRRSADFESAASASSAIPAREGFFIVRQPPTCRSIQGLLLCQNRMLHFAGAERQFYPECRTLTQTAFDTDCSAVFLNDPLRD